MNGENLFGLALTGGKSRRMGKDKSLLVYSGKTQRETVFDMLKPLCRSVYVSGNKDQVVDELSIIDMSEFENIGPMGGLLSAMKTFPGKDFLVVGCDYPFLESVHLKQFLGSIKRTEIAAAFYDDVSGFYEPVIGFYSSLCYNLLLERFHNKEYSLQHFLRSVDAGKFISADKNIMRSVDSKGVLPASDGSKPSDA